MAKLHPILQNAAAGVLPDWAHVDDKRLAHMERVAALLAEWADRAEVKPKKRARWIAVGYLHDALQNADEEQLRAMVPVLLSRLPGSVLHGPAVAERMRQEGVTDRGVLKAITYHTIGHPGLGTVGKILYAADFLEPGRNMKNKWRARLRERMPAEMDAVVLEILEARIRHLLKRRRPVRRETFAFWNELAGGMPWVPASEV